MGKVTRATLTAQIASLEASLGSTREALGDSQSENARLRGVLETRDRELLRKDTELARRSAELSDANNQHDQTKKRLERAQDRAKALRKASNHLIEIIAET